MTKIIYFDVEEKQQLPSRRIFDNRTYIVQREFEDSFKGRLGLAESASFTRLDFGVVITSKLTRISSDQNLFVKFDNSSYVFENVKQILIYSDIGRIDVRTDSSVPANVYYELFGFSDENERGALLLEDGGHLLLEDGGFILLE